MRTIFTLSNPNEERLMAIAAHPSRDGTLFLGTTRGVYMSENDGVDWEPYRLGMPSVPITRLVFDEGFLYAATYGRGLWRCRPCP
jgi:ligand-binding sensor domain-containing protein